MSFVRTVLGDLAPSKLGVCYAHEHVIIDESYTTQLHPEFLINDVDAAVRELLRFRKDGGRAMVDSMPLGGGRNAEKLAEVSRRSGVHLLAPTGLHLAKYYPPGDWAHSASREEMAERFVSEIEVGIVDDRPTAIRAGLIKVASGPGGPNAREREIFIAAAQAQVRTGSPILTHTEQGTGAMEQCRLFEEYGVDLGKVVLSHTDRKPERGYHREILATGVNVEFDSGFRWGDREPNPTLKLVTELFEDGFGAQVMLGMDAARRSYWAEHGGGPGMSWLLRTFIPRLRAAGLSEGDVRQVFVENPARAFAFGGKTDG